jgi:serine/threonine protein kinase
MIGQAISHYKIIEKLGEGGMGIVYKAQDTKLNRTVALKFLPDHISSSEKDTARFMQEAQAAASLNHPNICTIYGIEESEGKHFIVMEFVDGQTLQETMRADQRSAIQMKQAIEIGIQVAEGLAAAHEKGITHRDIKPENIMIRKDGIAQIMDFGLAKLRGATRLTKEGSTVGTAGYMSPEQVQGQETDHRSDIFSLGVLLYEMFTGQVPFKGVHETAIAYEIVNVDSSPMSAVRSDIPAELDAIVLDCLEKDPRERTQAASQVALELKRYRRESSRQRVSRVTAARPVASRVSSSSGAAIAESVESAQFLPASPLKRRIPWFAAFVFFLTSVVLALLFFRSSPIERNTIRSIITPPEKASFYFYGNTAGPPIISPDGKRIVFAAKDSSGKRALFVRSLDALEAQRLAGTEDAVHPFWSSDNQFVGFVGSGKLKKIDALGGPPLTICNSQDSRGGTWNKDGTVVFSPAPGNPLLVVSSTGGVPTAVTKLDPERKETTHRWPFFLPDGQHFLYFARTVATGAQGEGDAIRVASLDGKTNKVLVNASSNAVYASGYLLFVRGSSLIAQQFNPLSLELEGEATAIVQGIAYDPSTNRGLFSASENGVLVYQTGSVQIGSQLNLVDRSGKALGVIGDIGEYLGFRIAHDGQRIALAVYDQKSRNNDIWIYEIGRGLKTRFTFDPAAELNPVWSPDGNRVVFTSNRKGRTDLYMKSSSGAAGDELLLESPEGKLPTDWSSDGKHLAYQSAGDIWVLSMNPQGGNPERAGGDRKAIPFLQTEFFEGEARFSPDGRWIAYSSNESGQAEVYVRPHPQSGGKWQVSTAGGFAPTWRRDGRELYYVSVDGKLMVAEITVKGSTLEASSPRPLFEMRGVNYDVMSDGRRFILNIPVETQLALPLTLVVNWDVEVKKK